ncbi:MAG: VWA domain-containing protein [Verrucomicrobiota bacterium]
MNADFIFATDLWLWSIPVLLVCGISLWQISTGVGRRRLARFISPKTIEQILSNGHRRRLAEFLIAIVTLILLAIAMARPLTGPRPGSAERSGLDLVILLDVSKSMWVEDLKPNRLGAVKEELRDWLKASAGDRIGLVPFAGDAFIMAPLTFDYQALDFVLEAVGPRSISAGGSNIPEAIETAVELLTKNKEENARAILLISDGENLEGDAVTAARKAYSENKITIITIGVGTIQGGNVPADDYSKHETLPPEKRFVRNEYGTRVTSRIDERTLRAISSATAGKYYLFTPRSETFKILQNQILRPLARKSLTQHIDVADYIEWFQIPLGCALLLMLFVPTFRLFQRKTEIRETGVKVVQPETYSSPSRRSR